jgi:glycerate-2-kinase
VTSFIPCPSFPLRQITEDALAIWSAGVAAVRADRVVEREVKASGQTIEIHDQAWRLHPQGRLIVVGAGKAAFMMAVGLMRSLAHLSRPPTILGWLNVPEGTRLGDLDPRIHVCEARPQGINEPTPKVLEGTAEICQRVSQATARDTVICLLSGGGSALLSAPLAGISLADKLQVIRWMSQQGANIEELNKVRRSLSQVKGGGLARRSRAGQWITLIISDVLGDPLDIIASGPTVLEVPGDAEEALQILQHFDPRRAMIPASVYQALQDRSTSATTAIRREPVVGLKPVHAILANNATAVDAAGIEAVRRGYAYWMHSSPRHEGSAEEIGRQLARQSLGIAEHPHIQCLISGGEPSVVLPNATVCGRGGRNQQLVAAAIDEIQRRRPAREWLERWAILSGGTDGEDGPTDAAGAWADCDVLDRIARQGLNVPDYLQRCDAYHLFEHTQSLIKTGPTHTNVCDLRVAIVRPH